MSPESYREAKAFAQRRAALLPADSVADEKFLDRLRIICPAPELGPRAFMQPRKLSAEEREAYREGKHITRDAEIVHEEDLVERVAQKTAIERSRDLLKAARAAAEAKRAAAAAERWTKS
jgi:hypothetical protein